MLKHYFLLAILSLTTFVNGQQFKQLTNYQNKYYISSYDEIIENKDTFYHILKTYDNQFEIWKFHDNSNELIYKSYIDFCDKDISEGFHIDSFIIHMDQEQLYLYNFLTLTEQVLVFPENENIELSLLNQYSINDKIISFGSQYKYSFDIVLSKFVPRRIVPLLYRSNSSYYSISKSTINKRKIFSNSSTTTPVFPNAKFRKVFNNKLYFQDSLGFLYSIEKEDNITKSDFKLNPIDCFYKISNNEVGVLCNSNKTIIYSIDEQNNTLKDSTIISNDNNYRFTYFYNKKLFLTRNDNLYSFDYSDKSFKLLENYFRKSATVDSLVFFFPDYYRSNSLIVINTISLEKKEIPLSESELYFNCREIFKQNNKYYIFLNKTGEGMVYYKYDFTKNTLSSTNYAINKNKGLDWGFYYKGNTLYFSDFSSHNTLQIIDESEEDNIDELNLTDNIVREPFFYRNNIYFFTHIDSCTTDDEYCLKLWRYNPNSNKKDIIITDIHTRKKSFSSNKYYFFGDYFIFKKRYQEKVLVYNIETDKFVDISNELSKLLKAKKIVTKNYIYTNSIDNNTYQINNKKPFNIKNLGDYQFNSATIIEDDAFVYSDGDTLSYFDGNNAKIIFKGDSISYVNINSTSPNKKYYMRVYRKNNTKNFIIYDIELNKTIEIPKVLSEPSNVKSILTNTNFYILEKSNESNYDVFSFDLKTNESFTKHFDIEPKIISLGDDEIHFKVHDKIIITNYSLIQLEVVDGTETNFNENVVSPFHKLSSFITLHHSLLTYDREKKKFKEYFTCEENMELCKAISHNGKAYCSVVNDAVGHQVYVIDIDKLSNSTFPIENNNMSLKLFPNPSSDFITSKNLMEGYSIYDVTGNLIISSKQNADKINIKLLNPGVYLIVSKIENKVRTGKFVKL